MGFFDDLLREARALQAAVSEATAAGAVESAPHLAKAKAEFAELKIAGKEMLSELGAALSDRAKQAADHIVEVKERARVASAASAAGIDLSVAAMADLGSALKEGVSLERSGRRMFATLNDLENADRAMLDAEATGKRVGKIAISALIAENRKLLFSAVDTAVRRYSIEVNAMIVDSSYHCMLTGPIDNSTELRAVLHGRFPFRVSNQSVRANNPNAVIAAFDEMVKGLEQAHATAVERSGTLVETHGVKQTKETITYGVRRAPWWAQF